MLATSPGAAVKPDDACRPPDHSAELDGLARIEGQVRGIKQMINDGRYCVDILTQTRAVHAALRRVERNILASYLNTCVTSAFAEGTPEQRAEKVAEILALFDWENGRAR